MVDLSLVQCECPSVSFFFARLGVFLEKSYGKPPLVGSFLPHDYAAFRLVLLDFYPLIRHSLISYHVEMGDKEIETGVSESESSSSSSSDYVFEITLVKPSSSLRPSVPSKLPKSFTSSSRNRSSLRVFSSSSVTSFHALSKECVLDDLESIRGRFQILSEVVSRLPHPVHPFIHHLLSNLNVAPEQLFPNAWRMVVSCMAIWFIVHDGEMITLNEFLFLYKLKPSTQYGYFELFPWDK